MQIKVIIHDQDVKAALKRLQEKVGNLKPAMDEIGQRYERSVLDNFSKQSSPDGTPWLPNKVLSNYMAYTGTAKGKKRKEAYTKAGGLRANFSRFLENKRILVLTNALRGSIHYQATSNSVTIGSGNIPYAAIHQFGGLAGRGRKVRIPARPWLAINRGKNLDLAPRDKTMVLEVIERHIADGIK
jgi:phage virion morphogenesis protein